MLTLSLVPKAPKFKAGTLPAFDVRLRNKGKTPQRFCAYMLRYRLSFAMTAARVDENEDHELGLYPFNPAKWKPFQPRDFVSIKPGRAITVELAIAKLRGWAFINMADQPPFLVWKARLAGFPKGMYTFSTALLPRMAIYTGLDGAHDFSMEQRTLPEQIPGLPPGNYADVVREDMNTEVKVSFV